MPRPRCLLLLLVACSSLPARLLGRRAAGTRQVSVQTAGCLPSDDIASFFSYPQYRMRRPQRPEKGWDSWDTLWLCNMLPASLEATGVVVKAGGDISVGENVRFDLARGQTINTFPNARTETNNKAHLCMHVRSAFPRSSGRHIHAHCFVLPQHTEQLRAELISEPNARWVYKPAVGSGGKGIQLLSGQDIVNNNLLGLEGTGHAGYLQRYIVNTLLLDFRPKFPIDAATIKVKFDWRVYFAITSLHPLRVLCHRKGFARMATKPFSVATEEHASDPIRHIANMDFQKKFKKYRWSRSRHDDCTASCRSLQCVQADIAALTGRTEESIWRGVLDSIGQVGAALRPALLGAGSASDEGGEGEPECEGCYQLWGADLVFNTTGNAFVLEINTSPAIDRDDLLGSGSVMHDCYQDLRMAKGIDPTAVTARCDVNDMLRKGHLNRAWRSAHARGALREFMMGNADRGGRSMASMMSKLDTMIAEAAQQGDFDLAWPTQAAVLARLDEESGGGTDLSGGEHRDGAHLMSLEDARLYELFFAISQSPSALQSCFARRPPKGTPRAVPMREMHI